MAIGGGTVAVQVIVCVGKLAACKLDRGIGGGETILLAVQARGLQNQQASERNTQGEQDADGDGVPREGPRRGKLFSRPAACSIPYKSAKVQKKEKTD